MKYSLIIFDMDGTLVQSEDCASQALIDVIPALTGTAAEVTHRYRGMRLARIFEDIERHNPGAIPEDCLEQYRERENALSQTMIEPSAGADTLLSKLTTPKCIASNAPVKKTRRSLTLCGLDHHFPNGIFGADEIQAWKPEPTLFLHAAAMFSVNPEDCLVVEDSEVGLQAAQSAGMPAVYYAPHNEPSNSACIARISSLPELLDLV